MSDATPVGKEPGGWELYRGIQRIEALLGAQAAQFVPISGYTIQINGLVSSIGELKTQFHSMDSDKELEHKAIRVDYEAKIERLAATVRETEKARVEQIETNRRLRVGTYTSGAVAILGIVGGFLLRLVG